MAEQHLKYPGTWYRSGRTEQFTELNFAIQGQVLAVRTEGSTRTVRRIIVDAAAKISRRPVLNERRWPTCAEVNQPTTEVVSRLQVDQKSQSTNRT